MVRVKLTPRKNITKFSNKNNASQAARKTAPATGGFKKKNRFRPGTIALWEIRKYQ